MNEFKFWDKYMYLDEEELKLFNFILQFDFGDGNREYSCDELKKVLVMTVDGKGKVYLQLKGEKYKIIPLQWEEALW